jgi:hypothetical protein
VDTLKINSKTCHFFFNPFLNKILNFFSFEIAMGKNQENIDKTKNRRVPAGADKAGGRVGANEGSPGAGTPKPKAKTKNPSLPASAKKTTITEHQPAETKMDVQHHPQLDHKPKPWKEYMIEGLMIFIAVMMGFFAENIRETITNSQHVKQLTTRLVQDLKADTAQLNNNYKYQTQIVKDNDTLFALLQKPLAQADTKKIQQLLVSSHDVYLFHPSAVAIAAIKNELYLKQFSDSEIISYISTYEKHIELTRTAQDITLIYQRNYLDPFILSHFTPANLAAGFNRSPTPSAQMRNLTQEDMTQLATDMVLIRINTNELVRDDGLLKNDADSLLSYVTRQYHLARE